jgi:hypothetical protein
MACTKVNFTVFVFREYLKQKSLFLGGGGGEGKFCVCFFNNAVSRTQIYTLSIKLLGEK